MTRVSAFFGHEQWAAPDLVQWADRAEEPGCADVVVARLASTDLESTLRMFAAEVLPELRG